MLKMIRIKTKNSFIHKNAFYLLKFIFQIFCFGLLLYQFIDITNVYLNFPYEVKLNVTNDNSIAMPSITLCLNRSSFYHKKVYHIS